MLLFRGVMPYLVSLGDAQGNMSVRLLSSRAAQHTTLLGQFIDRLAAMLRAFTEKTESRDSPAGTNRIQGLC